MSSWFRIIIQSYIEKIIYSMAGRFRNEQNTIYIQYCRSCETHNWCTHHDESKYHDTFIKFSDMITKRLPHLEIIGNMVPQHLIPFKIAENKYIDANTNKYVVFPHIGSFQVTFRGKLIFSKKNTHAWPNLATVLSKVASIVDPNYRSPKKQEHPQEEDRQQSKIQNDNSFVDQEQEKKNKYKAQQKGFTLTDHFKLYRPKNTYQEKDWLTQKQESQASSKHISQMGRLQSRQKSNKSIESKKSSDLMGENKLKEMLKHKGALSKQHGKKEMIIRLDSIQQENACEQAAAATQRTQQKNVKKNRMKEIDEQINSLEDKFKNFENRVHDIQTRNKEFEQKDENTQDKNKFKQIIENKSQLSRKLSSNKQKESDAKQKALFADKTNKLEQYLNYSQQQKNDKLHRIYGEWKLIKQFNTKNKKLLKPKQKGAQEQEENESQSQQTSKADSHSPSSFANIITFKHKNEKVRNMKNQKQHKYSSMQRYTKSSSKLVHSIKNNTDSNFYKNHRLIKAKIPFESDAQINVAHHYQPTSKLVKKSFNTISMNALKSIANNSNLPKIQTDINSVQNYSQAAKQDIEKISNRISHIQEKLKHHNGGFSPIQQSPYNQREKNYSKKSQSQSGSQNKVSLKKINNIYNSKERNSNVSTNTIKKNYSQQKMKQSNFTELARPQTKKINDKNNEVIKQQNNVRQDRDNQYKPYSSKRKEARYIQSNEENPVVRQSHNQKVKSAQSTNRFSNIAQNIRNYKQKDEQHRLLKKDSKKLFQEESHEKLLNKVQTKKKPIKIKKAQKEANINRTQQSHHYEQTSQEEQQINHKQYQPHKPRKAKPLQRKFKDWRESSPKNHILKSKQVQRKQSDKQTSQQRKQQGKRTKRQKEVQQRRQSDSKQTVTRNKKQKPNHKKVNDQININNPIIEEKSYVSSISEPKNVRSGQIKKNRIVKQSIHKPQENLQNQQEQSSSEAYRNQQQEFQQSQNSQQQEQLQQNQDEEQQASYHSQQNQKQPTENSAVRNENIKKITKTLGYFKTTEMCIKGDDKLNSQNLLINQQKLNTAQDRQYVQQNENQSCSSQFVPQCKKYKKENSVEQKEELDGWNDKSKSSENEILPAETQQPLDHKQRKNSLDRELQDNCNERTSEPKYSYKTETVVERQNQEDNVNNQINQNQKKIEQIAKEQNIQKKVTKKVKKQKSKKEKQILKQQQQLELEQIACRQYSQFLQYKIANDLCFIEQEQEKVYQSCDYKVNLTNCKSEESFQQKIVANFMNFQTAKPAVVQQTQQMNEEQQSQQEQYSSEFQEQVQKQQAQVQNKEHNKRPQQNKVANQSIIIAPPILTQISNQNLQQTIQQSLIHQNPINQSQQKVGHQQEAIKPQQNHIQDKPTTNNVQNSNKQSLSNNTSNPSEPVIQNQTPSQGPAVDQPLDNVYCEIKKQQTSKFVQIGVQKELTLQVSIQTDSLYYNDTVFITKQGATFDEQIVQSRRSKKGRQTIHQNAVSEFDGTARNNYLSSTRNKFYPQGKSKRQIFRAKITTQIASFNKNIEMDKFQSVINGKQSQIILQQGSVAKLSSVYTENVFFNEQNLQIEMIQTKMHKFLKVLEILAERGDWILTRLFQDAKGILQQKAFGIWLCRNFQWECYVVDDNIQVDEENKPLYTYHLGNQKWANVLQKAVAQALGGYQKLAIAQTGQIFTLLTGCNAISVKVKEDPSKNAKLLQLVNECQRKNYIVHAQKNLDKAKHEKDRESIYYMQNVRKSNSEEQALVEISQDGRQSFWMRLSKFTQQFSKVEILQLRVNHSFTHVDIGVGKENKITVIELNFAQSGQGCVTLTYIDHVAPLFAYLYKQEKSKVLKLVGQAREKQKSHLFFQCSFNQGRYYVFAQTKDKQARLCYYGQNIPTLKITEEIYNDGLKNEVAEYLPIKDNNQHKPKRQLEQNWNDWRGKTPRLKDNFMESRLRQNFVQYIMGKTKKRDAQF